MGTAVQEFSHMQQFIDLIRSSWKGWWGKAVTKEYLPCGAAFGRCTATTTRKVRGPFGILFSLSLSTHERKALSS
jgi:hypothetical protein